MLSSSMKRPDLLLAVVLHLKKGGYCAGLVQWCLVQKHFGEAKHAGEKEQWLISSS